MERLRQENKEKMTLLSDYDKKNQDYQAEIERRDAELKELIEQSKLKDD